jgi:hypothetical protein
VLQWMNSLHCSFLCISHFKTSLLLTLTTEHVGAVVILNLYWGKVKQSLYRPWGFQEAEAPWFQDIRHMKVVRLTALCTGGLYSPGNIPSTHFC